MRELVAMETLNTTAMILKMTVEKLNVQQTQQQQQQQSPNSTSGTSPQFKRRSRQNSTDVLSWGVPDIAAWLGSKQLGMGGYVEMFVDQAIDGLALVGMKHNDLEDLGVFNEQHKKNKLRLDAAQRRRASGRKYCGGVVVMGLLLVIGFFAWYVYWSSKQ